MWKWLVLALVGIVVVIFVIAKPSQPAPAGSESNPSVSAPQTTTDQYVSYSAEALTAAAGKQKLLFFHAAWCPFCREAEADILKNGNQLPENLVIFKTDYDKESALKQEYSITYQHTFVLVDDDGNQLKKWNGGGVEEINRQLSTN